MHTYLYTHHVDHFSFVFLAKSSVHTTSLISDCIMNLAESIEILPIILSDQISKRSRNNLRGHLQAILF